MKQIVAALSIAAILAACCNTAPAPAKTDSRPPVAHAKPKSGDTAFITGRCAVLYSMSEKKIAVVKKDYKDEEEFESAMDDSYYYLANARDTLEKSHIRTIDTTGEKLYFKATNGKTFSLNFHGRDHVVDAYIFDGLHQPSQADLTDVMGDYNTVMKGQ